MKKIEIAVPAKINITLDVFDVENGFHNLKSLCSSINIFDRLTITKKRGSLITLKELGIKSGVSVVENNAYKAASLFQKTFSTGGVEIVINKSIPVGAGLGGSSADVAGVIRGMSALFKIKEDFNDFALSLGSDVPFMLRGGEAVMEGRGEKLSFIKKPQTLFINIITCDKMVTSKNCYREFDALGIKNEPCTDKCAESYVNKKFLVDDLLVKNDLYQPACKYVPEIEEKIKALTLSGAKYAVMTGSGSSVIGIYKNQKLRDKAFIKLYPFYQKQLLSAQTVEGLKG